MTTTEIEKYNADYYTNKTMQAFDNFKVDGFYTYDGIKANVNDWLKNKTGLFNLLRKHPNWNEEAKAVIFRNEEVRMPDARIYRESFNDLLFTAQDYPDIYHELTTDRMNSQTGQLYNLISLLRKFRDCFFDVIFSETMFNTLSSRYSDVSSAIHLSVGQKFSRVLNRFFKFCGLDKMEEYNKLFAKISDSINPLKATKISVLSVNFLDYLFMSNGNSWSTCQTIINNGCSGIYKAGTLSYANDKISMVYYTIDKDYEGSDYCLEPKITRQIFFYKKNLLVQERLYPKTHDEDDKSSDMSLVSQYRNLIESIIATCENKPNLWERATVGICASKDSFMYHDWDNFQNWVYRIKDEDIPKRITVGSTSYCLHCGMPQAPDSPNGSLYCHKCSYLVKCAHCGETIDRLSMSYCVIDDQFYHTDCGAVSYCDYHYTWELTQPDHMINVKGEGNICRTAFNSLKSRKRIFRCSECGEYATINNQSGDSNIGFYNNKPICNDCLDEISNRSDVLFDDANLTWTLTAI